MVYLDYNATSPLRPEARAAIEAALAETGNPSSLHARGRKARAVVEDSRRSVAAFIGTAAEAIVFTSSGTEANALALAGAVFGAAEAGDRILRLFVSAIEHPSVLVNAQAIADRVAGLRVTPVPVTSDGVVDLDVLRSGLREGKGRALVAVMAANNETGVVQPLADVTCLAREAGALVLVDAVQSAGKQQLDCSEIDYLTLSAHKLGGMQGVGALILREGAPFATPIASGGQERGLRGGTENVPGIAAFGAAAAMLKTVDDSPRIVALRDGFERRLKASVPGVVVFGEKAERLPHTSNFALPQVTAETALIALDLDGVMVSSGAACSSGKVETSHVLAAMGVPLVLAKCALRVSFGFNSSAADVDAAIESIGRLYARASARAA